MKDQMEAVLFYKINKSFFHQFKPFHENELLPHTDRILVEMFHNYDFKECLSVENLKL